MTRPEVLAQALLYASSRGFVDIVAILIKVNQKTPALINLKPQQNFTMKTLNNNKCQI
jgi:hypothetical protein